MAAYGLEWEVWVEAKTRWLLYPTLVGPASSTLFSAPEPIGISPNSSVGKEDLTQMSVALGSPHRG